MKKIEYDNVYYKRGSRLGNDVMMWIDLVFFKKYFIGAKNNLEIGCGNGKVSDWLNSHGVNLEAIDISKDAINIAQTKNRNTKYFCGDIFDFGGKNGKYDVIFSMHVFEHIKEIDKTLSEIKRILNHSGKLVFRIPNSNSVEAKIAGKKWFHWDEPYHVYHWKDEEIIELLRKHNFINISVNYKLIEYKQVLLYSVLNWLGISTDRVVIRYLVLPFQLIFLPISLFLGFVFNNSGTIEVVAEKK
jgi:SAM-dependent methyltransferase